MEKGKGVSGITSTWHFSGRGVSALRAITDENRSSVQHNVEIVVLDIPPHRTFGGDGRGDDWNPEDHLGAYKVS